VISWRYHIVSIVAVVLAFGLGILAGSAVVDDVFVSEITANYEKALEERDEARRDAALLELFAVQLRPTLRDDRLLGREAVVLTMEGVERPTQRVVDELAAAGADVTSTLTLTRRLAEPTAPDDLEALQEILGTTATDPADVARRAAGELADRLAVGAPVGREDLLARLLDGGFVTADRDLDPATLRDVGGVTTSVVVAAGNTASDGSPAPEALLLPVTERLVQLEALVAVAGPVDDRYGLVDAVRDDPQVPDCSVVTVDDIDMVIGGIALVLGLERLVLDPDPGFRPGGDYGVRVEALVPGGEPPSSCRE
jgi:hypothetical protein